MSLISTVADASVSTGEISASTSAIRGFEKSCSSGASSTSMEVDEASMSTAMPSTTTESSRDPPGRAWSVNRELLKSTDCSPETASSANSDVAVSSHRPVTVVAAIEWSWSRSSSDTGVAYSCSRSVAYAVAFAYPSTIDVGWRPSSSNDSAASSNSPTSRTVVVVPSLTVCACVSAASITIRAVGSSTSTRLRMLDPVLVTTTVPFCSTIILSIPFGPSVVRRAAATAWGGPITVE